MHTNPKRQEEALFGVINTCVLGDDYSCLSVSIRG